MNGYNLLLGNGSVRVACRSVGEAGTARALREELAAAETLHHM